MKPFLLLALLLGLLMVGCAGNSARRGPPPNWQITPAPTQTLQNQPTPSTVFVQGPVRYQKILWSPGMTLSRAIVTAQYTDRRNPRAIYVTRHGERYPVDPVALLRGELDPAIEPGDLIELQQ